MVRAVNSLSDSNGLGELVKLKLTQSFGRHRKECIQKEGGVKFRSHSGLKNVQIWSHTLLLMGSQFGDVESYLHCVCVCVCVIKTGKRFMSQASSEKYTLLRTHHFLPH